MKKVEHNQLKRASPNRHLRNDKQVSPSIEEWLVQLNANVQKEESTGIICTFVFYCKANICSIHALIILERRLKPCSINSYRRKESISNITTMSLRWFSPLDNRFIKFFYCIVLLTKKKFVSAEESQAFHTDAKIWMPELHAKATPTGILRRYVLFTTYVEHILQNILQCIHCYAKYVKHMPLLLIGCLTLTSMTVCFLNSFITTEIS